MTRIESTCLPPEYFPQSTRLVGRERRSTANYAETTKHQETQQRAWTSCNRAMSRLVIPHFDLSRFLISSYRLSTDIQQLVEKLLSCRNDSRVTSILSACQNESNQVATNVGIGQFQCTSRNDPSPFSAGRPSMGKPVLILAQTDSAHVVPVRLDWRIEPIEFDPGLEIYHC